MAPEQVNSAKDLTTAADVYSLGAVLVFALTAHYPYERPTVPATLYAIADAATPPDLAGVPEILAGPVTGMLAHAPAARPTLAEVTVALTKVLAQRADPGAGLRRLAEATYRERPTDPPPADPPRARRPRLPEDPRVPSVLVQQVADNLRRDYAKDAPFSDTQGSHAHDRKRPDAVPARGADRRPGHRMAGPQLHARRTRRLQDQGHRRVGVRPRGGRRLLHRARRPEAGPPAARGDDPRPRRHPGFAMSRLYLEAALRRTPLPQSERGLAATPDSFLLDKLTYQQRPAELALKNLRPRILLADVVGLGKTLEIGLILAELIRRGRGDRILVVTPQQVLEQFQLELWTRFAIPLIRLDSLGIERIQREIPAGRNPFTYYKRIIISIDTLKNEGRYGQHLDAMHWDAVVIDESHNLIGERNLRNRLAKRLAKRTDALLLASATPHNGDARSFAELIDMLDPAAIADDRNYAAKDIAHLYIRRTKISDEVTNEIGGKWRERGPSQAIRCPASPAEEDVFAELTRVWLADPTVAPGAGTDRRLFPYTLLKAFLSSHKALAVTARKRAKNTGDETERAALTRLAALADQVTDDDSAKLTALVAKLREIGVGPYSTTRAVVFSESVPTLEWLRNTLPGRLGLTKEGQVELMHGALSDIQQHGIIERFSLDDPPVRVLLTGDVASEGVNMHKQCHHLIHYDLPWSLIRIEQRNGRIDRYGQVHQPEFAALILISQTEGAKDDTTVAEKLLAREATAHSQLGTAEGVTRQFTSKKEEDRLVKDLLAGKTVDESIDAADAADPSADFLADLLAGVGDQPENPAPDQARVPRLFGDTEAFARAALGAAAPELRVDDDGEMLAFRPPDDLVQRLSVLPPSYLKMHDITERMRVTFSRTLAQKNLDEAQRTKTLWPEIAYLSDLHPMIEWLTDKVLLRVPRQQAPVLIAAVDEPSLPRPGRLLQRARPAHGRGVDGGHRPARRAARRRHGRRPPAGEGRPGHGEHPLVRRHRQAAGPRARRGRRGPRPPGGPPRQL